MGRNRFGAGSAALALWALAFNAAMVGAPLAAAELYQAVVEERAFDHHRTPYTEEATRRAIEASLATLADPQETARDGWAALVGRELVAGDLAAARGFLLSADAILSPPEAARLSSLLPADGDDERWAQIAADYLPEDVRRHLEELGGPYERGAPAPAALGGPDDFAQAVALAGRGEPTDRFSLALTGFALYAPEAGGAPRIAAGAALLRAARRAGALTPALSAYAEARIAAAAPPARIDAAIADAALAVGTGIDPALAAGETFAAALDPAGSRDLAAFLERLAMLSEAGGASNALRLLPFAEGPEDLAALTLVATAGDRAAAAAKYAADADTLRGFAPRTLEASPRLTQWGAALAGCLGLALAAPILTLGALRAGAPPPKPPAKPPRRAPTAAAQPPTATPEPRDAVESDAEA